MRRVHDILRSRRHPGVVVSFVQHGTRTEGFVYEVICPYCAKTVGWVDDRPNTFTYASLLHNLRRVTGQHIEKCEFNGAATLAVEVTREPLHTDTIPTIM